ncbi:unnamed protein product [Rotaria socialis]
MKNFEANELFYFPLDPTADDPIIMIQHQVNKCNVAGGLFQWADRAGTVRKPGENASLFCRKPMRIA